MNENDTIHRCERPDTINRLVSDCEAVKESKNRMEVILNELQIKMDNLNENMNTKFEQLLKKLDKHDEAIDSNTEDISKLKKLLESIKYIAIGGIVMFGLTQGDEAIGWILKLISKGSL